MGKKTTSVYIDEELLERAQGFDDRSFSTLVEDALRQYLDWSEERSEMDLIQTLQINLDKASEAATQLERQKESANDNKSGTIDPEEMFDSE